jgi:hypothetical protein
LDFAVLARLADDVVPGNFDRPHLSKSRIPLLSRKSISQRLSVDMGVGINANTVIVFSISWSDGGCGNQTGQRGCTVRIWVTPAWRIHYREALKDTNIPDKLNRVDYQLVVRAHPHPSTEFSTGSNRTAKIVLKKTNGRSERPIV